MLAALLGGAAGLLLLAYASDEEEINPGDVISAGTIGFSCSVDSGRWPKPGDVYEHWIENIGAMTMTCVRHPRETSYVRDGLPGLLPLRFLARTASVCRFHVVALICKCPFCRPYHRR